MMLMALPIQAGSKVVGGGYILAVRLGLAPRSCQEVHAFGPVSCHQFLR